MSREHTVALGDTEWRVWRHALLRAAGFPADGIKRFAAPALAAAAETAATAADERFRRAYDDAVAELSTTVTDLAADPTLREAVAWQNPKGRESILDAIVARGADAPRNARRRSKEAALARYYSRYTTKNDTIGFFGPVCWARLEDVGPAVDVKPGSALVRRREVFLERWALDAYAEALLADDDVRVWAAPRLAPNLLLDGEEIVEPSGARRALTPTEARIVSASDGSRPAVELASELASDPSVGARRPDDVLLGVSRLLERGVLRWDFDLPMSMRATEILAARLAAIGDDDLRDRATAGLSRLLDQARRVGAAADDEVALAAALADLDAAFVELTGHAATRAEGQMYAGRTVCFEETVRDLDVRIGPGVLAGLAAPLDLLLRSARWLSVEVGEVFERFLDELFDDLSGGAPSVPLGSLWFLAQGFLFGASTDEIDAVTDEFTRRWARILGLDGDGVSAGGNREVLLSSADLKDAVGEAFPARPLRWSSARYHSPDVHLVLDPADPAAPPTFVLGELHAAWNTATPACFVFGHDAPDELQATIDAELPPGRVVPVFPVGWPRLTARTNDALIGDDVVRLGIDADAPGSDAGTPLPISALAVQRGEGGLYAVAADGRRWPVAEIFADLLSSKTVDAFKLLARFEHCPRVRIDDVVIARESWTIPASELGFTTVEDQAARYLAIRRWLEENGVPDRVFVKTGAEVKPMYLDLTSPVFADILCVAIRAAQRDGGSDAPVTFSEMLPTPEQAFVPDADGRRYVSELRLQIVDPQTVAWAGPQT
ncbi:lantibiotic dehydratase [Nocardioides sp. GXZ039]|uniref:lantibiotic dehydratase n=1 Tax=Nocardioides sp. GXZ039 TaxID=3136018 RepID=UPI0030F42310